MDNNRVPCSPDQIPDPNNPVTTPNLRNPYPVPVPAINSNKTSWSLKTPLSPGPYFKWKLFCCALFICLLCSFGIITYLGIEVYNSSNRSNNQAKNICLTPACVKTASSLLTAMDQTTSPCSDFFQFACGNWNKLHLIPEDRPSISTFEILSDSIQMELRRLLERNYTKMKVKKEKHTPSSSDSGSHGSAIRKVTDFYKSCMNLTSIRLVGEDPIIHLVRQLGGWPVVEGTSWRPTLSVEELIGKVRLSLNMGVLLELWIGPDDKNSSNNIIQIDQMQLGLPSRDYFLNISREIVAYHKYMVEIAVLFGADESFAAQDMNDVILFETTLANISLPEADRHDTSSIYRKQTLFSLETMIPGFDWKKYFNSFLVGPKITDEEKIVTYSFDYVEKMARVIEQTEPRVIQNYVIWRVLMDLTSYLLDKFQDSKIEFRKILMGVTSERSRWNQCVEWTNKKLGMGLGAMFIEDNFEHEAKETAQEMITEIRRALIELLDENHWMDTATRSVAKEKAMKMNERIGYPDYLTKPYELDKEYRNLTISQHHFVQNLINWGGWKARENLKKLKTPVDKEKWSTEPAVVNAFYDPNKNDIVFPAGILQPLFYSHTFPKSLNYGGIGVVIGHEITHGFDDKGRQFDWEGNLKEWWNNETIIAFRSQSQCIIDQYSQYEVGEEGQAWRIDGRLTVGENIADNGGLKQAYRAFKKWESLHGPEPLLPGLDHMTHDQYFFLNYAQIWCGSSRPEDLLNKIRSAVHSPGSIRVLGPLSNSIEFSKAFNCPLGTRMNPEQKCVVW